MSLFGNSNATSGAGGLFGSTTASSQPPSSASNLFGGGSGGGGLFGKPAATATQAGSSSSGGNLFGGLGQTSQAPNNTSSNLFGSLNAASSAPASNNLFGATKTTSNAFAPVGKLFVADTTSQPQPSNGSVFGNDILPSTAANEQLISQSLNPGASHPEPAYFHAVLDRGKRRQADDHVHTFGPQLPQLELGLADISRKVRKIGQGGPSASIAAHGVDARSHYLLAASGVNTNQALRDIEELANTTSARYQPTPEIADYNDFLGVKEGLTQFHSTKIHAMVNNRINEAKRDFDKMIDERLHNVDWTAHRQRIYEHFGLAKPGAEDDGQAGVPAKASFGKSSRRSKFGAASTLNKSFGMPGLAKSVIGTTGPRGAGASVFEDVAERMPEGIRPAPEDRVRRMKQDRYVDKVKDLNIARLQEKIFPLLKQFSEVEAEPSNEDTSMLVNAYKALVEITGEDATKENTSDPGAIRERQYSQGYLAEPFSTENVAIRKRIINGSRRFLEKLFYSQVEAVVVKNPREANVGGVPTAVAKVKGYVRVRAARKELGPDLELLQELNDNYCWPVLFYLLRSGLYQETLEYLEENQGAFRQIDRAFMRYLRAFVTSSDHRLPPDMQLSIHNEYSQRQRLAPEDSIDPYRMMCYKVVGRCDLERRSLDNITNDMLDWLWLQFALAREFNSRADEMAFHLFGLEGIQKSIREIGERYFGPSSDITNAPTTFFFMQILSGMFERAVADLYPHSYVSAVHFAIALGFYGLLRVRGINASVDTNDDRLLDDNTSNEPQIAFGSMIGLYTRDFRTSDATAAIDYITLINLNSDLHGTLGINQRRLCHQAITEVVLETRDFAQLLGDIRYDGHRIPGAVEQRVKLIGINSQKEFLKQITLVAARTAEEQSRVTDAALLFHLAEDYDKVLHVCNEAVSLALTTELGEQPARLTPLKPRNTVQPVGQQQAQEPLDSLSLTTVDDPIVLARNMSDLYNSNQMYASHIEENTRDACRVLLQLSDARAALEAGRWALVIDHIANSRVLPIDAQGQITPIRQKAQAFDSMPTVVSRAIGHVMIWTVLACGNQAEHLRRQGYETGTTQDTIQRCVSTAKDVMVFAGLIRFKLPGRVWEMLAQRGQELGAY